MFLYLVEAKYWVLGGYLNMKLFVANDTTILIFCHFYKWKGIYFKQKCLELALWNDNLQDC